MDITVYVTSPLTASERRISLQWSLEYLKTRLQAITGIEPQYQQLFLYPISHSSERTELKSSNDALETLEQFQIRDSMRIHVKDTNPDSQLEALETGNEVNPEEYRFKLSEESYAKRNDTVMSWKKQNQLGRFDPSYEAKKEEQLAKIQEAMKTLAVGQRCKIKNESIERRGTIRYIGKVTQIDPDSTWCGIEFDEPLGKNDGSIKGVQYFECRQNYGSFISPLMVESGDFPMKDHFIMEEDESDDEL